MKQIIRSLEPRNYRELHQASQTAREFIILKDIHNWFTHCCYCDASFSPHLILKNVPHYNEKRCKLHLVVNEKGELLNVKVTPENVDDRVPVTDLLESMFGKVFAD